MFIESHHTNLNFKTLKEHEQTIVEWETYSLNNKLVIKVLYLNRNKLL